MTIYKLTIHDCDLGENEVVRHFVDRSKALVVADQFLNVGPFHYETDDRGDLFVRIDNAGVDRDRLYYVYVDKIEVTE